MKTLKRTEKWMLIVSYVTMHACSDMEVFTEHVHVVVVNTKVQDFPQHLIANITTAKNNHSVINLSLFSVMV